MNTYLGRDPRFSFLVLVQADSEHEALQFLENEMLRQKHGLGEELHISRLPEDFTFNTFVRESSWVRHHEQIVETGNVIPPVEMDDLVEEGTLEERMHKDPEKFADEVRSFIKTAGSFGLDITEDQIIHPGKTYTEETDEAVELEEM